MSGDKTRATRDSALADALSRNRAIERPGFWYDLDVESPWSNVGAPYRPAQYSRGRYGLRFRGAVFGGTTEPIGHLPADWWPEFDERYVISRGDGSIVAMSVSSTDGALVQILPP